MNEIEVPTAPAERQQAYLRHLAARAHDAGMPHLHIASFTRAQANEWIDYLRVILETEERVRETLERARQAAEQLSAYFVTPHRATSCQRATVPHGHHLRRPMITSTSSARSCARMESRKRSASCAG